MSDSLKRVGHVYGMSMRCGEVLGEVGNFPFSFCSFSFCFVMSDAAHWEPLVISESDLLKSCRECHHFQAACCFELNCHATFSQALRRLSGESAQWHVTCDMWYHTKVRCHINWISPPAIEIEWIQPYLGVHYAKRHLSSWILSA